MKKINVIGIICSVLYAVCFVVLPFYTAHVVSVDGRSGSEGYAWMVLLDKVPFVFIAVCVCFALLLAGSFLKDGWALGIGMLVLLATGALAFVGKLVFPGMAEIIRIVREAGARFTMVGLGGLMMTGLAFAYTLTALLRLLFMSRRPRQMPQVPDGFDQQAGFDQPFSGNFF